ncbi:MAG: hypothetical protein EU542_07600 [Promethearchaeota archaeon]|nr:MAG: hypothetical protein EU542_07600 [Candidatus Lokiarchaeota archaeon]
MTFFRSSKSPPLKLKSFKKDIAPIGFFFDIIFSESFKIPILPVPLRIDKLTNGEPTVIIFPNTNELDELCSEYNLNINYNLLYSIGLNNLITHAKIKYKEITLKTLNPKKINEWWNSSKNLSSKSIDLMESFTLIFSEFIRVFGYKIKNNLKFNDEVFRKILIEYCDKIIKHFRFKIEENIFKMKQENLIIQEKLYIEKKKKCYPLVHEISVLDRSNNKTYTREFVPYLIYDDILNCFYYNKSILKKELSGKMINLKLYEDFNIISSVFSFNRINYKHHSDLHNLEKLKLNKILEVYKDLKI